jgi:hypothetical protein
MFVYLSENYTGYAKPFAELIQFLPSDIRQYFVDIQSEYRANLQDDDVALTDVERVTTRRKLWLDSLKSTVNVNISLSLQFRQLFNLFFTLFIRKYSADTKRSTFPPIRQILCRPSTGPSHIRYTRWSGYCAPSVSHSPS